MIKMIISYKGRDAKNAVTLLHDYDQPTPVCTWDNPVKECWLRFDASGLYSKVKGISPAVIRTEIGLFKRDELIHLLIPKHRYAGYSGVSLREENPVIRAYTPYEKGIVTRFINKEKINGRPLNLTPRMLMLCRERMQEVMNKEKIDEEWIIQNYIRHAEGNGGAAVTATDRLATLGGVDISKPIEIGAGSANIATYNPGKRLPQKSDNDGNRASVSDIRELLKNGKVEEAKVV